MNVVERRASHSWDGMKGREKGEDLDGEAMMGGGGEGGREDGWMDGWMGTTAKEFPRD